MTPSDRYQTVHKYQDWLTEIVSLPTAAGREDRVIAWVHRWAARRRNVIIRADRFGNLLIRRRTTGRHTTAQHSASRRSRPIYFTAHMDHPAFVVTHITAPRGVRAVFRGGVADSYFVGSKVLGHQTGQPPIRGKVRSLHTPTADTPAHDRGQQATIALQRTITPEAIGSVMTWDTGPARVRRDRLLAPACADLAGVAAALSAFDALGRRPAGDVRVLLTRAEEVGFVGAIGACRSGIIPKTAQLIALECSKSFADSPIGGGPIVRVGDRTSTFNPELTHRLARIAQQLADRDGAFVWQRRLMAGGTCEATAYQAYGYTAACLCLPLGNYHNMDESTGRIAAETISLRDYHGLVRLLIQAALRLNDANTTPPLRDRLDKLFAPQRDLLTG